MRAANGDAVLHAGRAAEIVAALWADRAAEIVAAGDNLPMRRCFRWAFALSCLKHRRFGADAAGTPARVPGRRGKPA